MDEVSPRDVPEAIHPDAPSERPRSADFDTSYGLLSDLVARVRALGTDTAHIEVKASVRDLPKSVWETVSAFANGEGGVVILGLDERTGFLPAEGFDPATIRDKVVSGLTDGPGARVRPPPPYELELAVIDEAPVVIIDVAPLPPTERPCFVVARGVQQGSFVRIGDGDRQMDPYAIYLLEANRRPPADDRQPVEGASRDDLDEAAVARYLDRLRQEGRAALSDRPSDGDALTRLNILAEGGRPTLAGLLALGRYPQQFFPQLLVTVAVFPTTTRDDTADGLRLLDNQAVDGPIPTLVARTVGTITRNLRRPVREAGLGGATSPEIPVGVLREAVANAVMHRDYGERGRGTQVRVEVFPDRVEIISPGGVWGGRDIEALIRGGSQSRNAALSAILMDVTDRDTGEVVVENKGTGLARMIALTRKNGLPIPSLEDRTTEFVVTLWRHGLLDPSTWGWLERIGADGLPRAEQCALALVRQGRRVDDQVLRHQLGIDTRDAQLTLARLVRGGWLEEDRRRSRYRSGPKVMTADQPTLPILENPVSEVAGSGGRRSTLDMRVLAAVRAADGAVTVQQISSALHLLPTQIRPALRRLVLSGEISATAPATSRHRAYTAHT